MGVISGVVTFPCTFIRQLSKLKERTASAYGNEFTHFLVVVYCGLKGFVDSLTQSAMLPMFQSLGVSAGQYQLALVVTQVPWAAKGCIGVLSDCFPIGRYHKRGYLLLSSGLGYFGILGLAVLLTSDSSALGSWAAVLAAVMIMLVNFQLSTFDLLSEGKYSELMQQEGIGSEVLTLVWTCVNFGSLMSALVVYFLIDHVSLRSLVSLNLLPMFWAGRLAYRGSMPEEPAKSRKALRQKLMSSPRLFALAFVMALGAMAVATAAAVASSRVRLAVTLTTCVVLVVLSFYAMPWTLAMSNFYMFLASALYVDIGGPLGYYYTAGPGCVPGGPNFSYGYYLAIGSFVGAIAGTLGSWLFQAMSTWTFRKAFSLTTIVQVVASLFDLLIVKRWNLHLGISDEAMYFFGDGACQQLANMLITLPAALLTSRLCPRGAEATVYAVLAGFSNFGGSVSQILGVLLAETMGIDSGDSSGDSVLAEGLSCDFSALPMAIILSHGVLPLMVLPLTCYMVPDARMDEEDAFAVDTPAPSFFSGITESESSPFSRLRFASPASPHAWPGQDHHSPYRSLPSDDEDEAEKAQL